MYVYQSQFCSCFNVAEVVFQLFRDYIYGFVKGKRWVNEKLTTPYNTWISVGDIFHVFASLANLTEFLILCVLLFSVGCIILMRYLEIP